ncbi:ATP-binding protein [candidate division KSB1 bacterium]|nr:ATP-binding protein [candidate division KSB1 bacterium]
MIADILIKFNSWWTTGQIPKQFIKTGKRFFFEYLYQCLENPYILLLTGLRRTGKTVLIYHCIEKLLEDGIPPQNILYLSFEDISIVKLNEILDAHQKLALPKGQIYCFFDEIHYLPDWSNQIKYYYDQKANMKFIVSGSSSHLLLQKTSESLAGRVTILPLYPMTYREYLHLNNTSLSDEISLSKMPLQDIFDNKLVLMGLKEQFQSQFDTYLKFGGIIEHLDKSMSIESWYQFLRQNFLALVLFKDVLLNYEIRDSRTLLKLVQYLASTITSTYSYASISSVLGVKKETIANYIKYLEEAFLVAQATFFSESPAKALRRNSKIYLSDIGLIQSLGYYSTSQSIEFSKIVENFVFQELHSFVMQKTGIEFPTICYWKNKHEVDFIIKMNDQTFPVEVKYANKIDSKDLRGIIDFCQAFDINSGVIVTKDTFEVRTISEKFQLYLIPLHIFALLLG